MRGSSPFADGSRSRGLVYVLALTLAVAGVYLLLLGGWGGRTVPPDVHEAGALPPPSAAGAARPASAVRTTTRPVRPVSLEIPRIHVSTSLLGLGLNADRTLEVPPLSQADRAGWYLGSVPPGEPGSSVIAGHVDSESGPAVFYDLSVLRPGDQIRVRRDDRRTAIFRVDRVASFDKDHFPTRLVYGKVAYAGLRLITCGGPYDASRDGYQNNTVVFAELARMSR